MNSYILSSYYVGLWDDEVQYLWSIVLSCEG